MNASLQISETLAALNGLGSEAMLQWALMQHGRRAAIFTSFQNTGCVMIDMAHRVAPGLRVITVDTLRLPRETYDLMEILEQRYGISIERFKPDPQRLEKMIRDHGEYLFFDSRAKQEFCCKVRKVEPNDRALDTVDVWITGLRRDQSKARMITPKAALIDHKGREILKLCPLIDWTEEQVREYLANHRVPYNTLYDKGYTSIGCQICSTPTRPGEDKRAGRWRWMNQLSEDHHKECGLHTRGSGI
ncbi:MAG TPA: phosphoadenylyl-sulfate reductase [Candidatus Hydrogenedentes bacterium]|nr:phosphoadenylyl-sulfate reductase [Candidatus Hydrogenedentota bacterium]HRT20188.1 phosphoadenylyl-sulfate reductase [Candidatus Hydrogenedentota bacterium]HRT63222.1 phosphoadenylyl-sulfate reductase [Candidatus Hydrogenedentota bacterium]